MRLAEIEAASVESGVEWVLCWGVQNLFLGDVVLVGFKLLLWMGEHTTSTKQEMMGHHHAHRYRFRGKLGKRTGERRKDHATAQPVWLLCFTCIVVVVVGQVFAVAGAQGTTVSTDSFSRGYDIFPHARRARSLTDVG